jgi:sucrose-6-phosphate hydrolase SacC (GH32 family)
VFHAFYQYNPRGVGWGNMSWGHAMSEDLVSWRECEVAIPCTPTEQVYSGSAVVDRGNTSGLGVAGVDPVVAIYTAVAPDGAQAQALAFSQDRGDTWERYAGNPVLDRGSREFRDPKVFRYGGGLAPARWIMVAVEAVAREVLVYSSVNLREWKWESNLTLPTEHDGVWECPDLFALPIDGDERGLRWVMVISTNTEDPADPQGSATHWLLGDFDGSVFAPASGERWRLLDHGRDFYAGVTFSDVPAGRRLMLGWMSNWQYARDVPTAPFRGALSLARELSLRTTADAEVELMQRPAMPAGLEWRSVPVPGGEPVDIDVGLVGLLEVEPGLAGGQSLTLELCSGDAVLATVTLDGASGELVFDRLALPSDGIHTTFPSVRRMPLGQGEGSAHVQLFLDAHLVEILACDGAAVMSHQVFVGPEGWRIRVASDESTRVRVAVPGGGGSREGGYL